MARKRRRATVRLSTAGLPTQVIVADGRKGGPFVTLDVRVIEGGALVVELATLARPVRFIIPQHFGPRTWGRKGWEPVGGSVIAFLD